MEAGAVVEDRAIQTELRSIIGRLVEELVEIVTRLAKSP